MVELVKRLIRLASDWSDYLAAATRMDIGVYLEVVVDDFNRVVLDVEMRGDSPLVRGAKVAITFVEPHHLCLPFRKNKFDNSFLAERRNCEKK